MDEKTKQRIRSVIFILEQILKPTAHRIATNIGTALGTYGVATNDVQLVVAAIPVVIGLLVDLIIRKVL